MKALLALFLAIFAFTAAVPAAAARGACDMAGGAMQDMAMSSDKGGAKDPCCDHAPKSCASACDAVCVGATVMPTDLSVMEVDRQHLAVTAPRLTELSSVNPSRVDPPPKPI